MLNEDKKCCMTSQSKVCPSESCFNKKSVPRKKINALSLMVANSWIIQQPTSTCCCPFCELGGKRWAGVPRYRVPRGLGGSTRTGST